MASRGTFAAAGQRIHSLACAGLGSVELRLSALHELARVCPAEGAFFPTADPARLLYTSAVRVGMPDGLTGQFLSNEFHAPDVNKFRSLAVAPVPVATLDTATRGDRPASPRFREIMRLAGLGDELRAVFRTGTATGDMPACTGHPARPSTTARSASSRRSPCTSPTACVARLWPNAPPVTPRRRHPACSPWPLTRPCLPPPRPRA